MTIKEAISLQYPEDEVAVNDVFNALILEAKLLQAEGEAHFDNLESLLFDYGLDADHMEELITLLFF